MESVTKALTGAAVMFGVPWDSDQLRAYLVVLGQSGASDDRLARGVVAACANCKFMPKPADILEHLPPYTDKLLPAADDDLSDDDRAFNKAVGPLFMRYLSKSITKTELVDQMCQIARDLGIQDRVDYQNFSEGKQF